jgi:hypothetical protein
MTLGGGGVTITGRWLSKFGVGHNAHNLTMFVAKSKEVKTECNLVESSRLCMKTSFLSMTMLMMMTIIIRNFIITYLTAHDAPKQ